MDIRKAAGNSSRARVQSRAGRAGVGKPFGITPTMETPNWFNAKRLTAAVERMTAMTGPALLTVLAASDESPTRINKGLSPLRTQNRKAIDSPPMISVGPLVS